MQTVAVIPARYNSTRFPGKPLVDIQGKTMIQRVYEQAAKSIVDNVIVATDDERIAHEVRSFGGLVEMTSTDHASGTDRIAEVIKKYKSSTDLVINVQGDEPFIQPEQINVLIEFLQKHEQIEIATLIKPITKNEDIQNPSIVKVVKGLHQEAIYFSRSPIPYHRPPNTTPSYFKHIGIYGYTANALLSITQLPQGKLEMIEKLEQLRWLENNWKIGLIETDLESIAIDYPKDLEKL